MGESLRGAVILLCLLLASGCLTAEEKLSEPISQTPAGEFTHPGTRFRFPESIGGFQRVEVMQYDESGEDVSVGYNLGSEEPISATIYMYPGRDILNLGSESDVVDAGRNFLDEEEFEAAKEAILETAPGLTLVSEEEWTMFSGGGEQPGKRAIFQGPGIIDRAPTLMRTEVDLFGYGDWFVKYRFTYLGESLTAPALILDFMNSLEWPTG